jgi:SAM-dependent methyltransferase
MGVVERVSMLRRFTAVKEASYIPGIDPGESYTDPRLVDLYDLENTSRSDIGFYLRLADDLGARRVIDLGCGTGVLTRALAAKDREVTGIDPAAAMLAYARSKTGADQVHWIEGDSSALGTANADLVLMTGNVSQVFLDDNTLETTLRDIHLALQPGGYLAFESRNPADKPWLRWHREATRQQLDSLHGPVETWLEVEAVSDERVQLLGYNHFLTTGETVIARETLRFRSAEEWTTSLVNAGLTVERTYGDWDSRPLRATSPIMVFIVQRVHETSRAA